MTVKDPKRLDDHYSRLARRQGYPARSVYKLEEFDQKHHLFKTGQKVLDLGCAPGGWSLYAAKKVGAKGTVVGCDLNPPKSASFPSQVIIDYADLLADPPEFITALRPFDVVLSDVAPKTTGRREVDQARSLELCSAAWAWTRILLMPGGAFLYKVFQSPEAQDLIKSQGPFFQRQLSLKPKASRSESQEIFVLGLNYTGLTLARG
ncbi:MAG: RlmE family RNA methyltransferase [Deltaproteobacteria bacterium]|jgi:23S rRNA (uridine2552-2'-O)-methyltransferase|nr:RlmE family RNA methyltransferase [Deltaproteobacteria bacterium]